MRYATPLQTSAKTTTMRAIRTSIEDTAGGNTATNGRSAMPPKSWLPPAIAIGFAPAARMRMYTPASP